MKGIFHVWKRAIPPDLCNRLMEEATNLPKQEAMTGTKNVELQSSGPPNKDIRDSEVRWFPINVPRYKWIYDYVNGFVQIANRQMFGVDLWGPQSIQYTEYNGAGTHYDWHMDSDLMDYHSMEHRKLSCVMLLNDKKEYRGGAFEIEGHDNIKKQFKDQGDVVVFPSFLRHRVKKVTKGSRHSLVSWYGGPKWR